MTTTPRTDDEIRSEVRKHYGTRVEGALQSNEGDAAAEAGDCGCATTSATASCCGPTEASTDASCCGPEAAAAEEKEISLIAKLYKEDEVEDLPNTVTDVAFGCGNPTAISALKPGETVLDLGSGGGIDVFLAAKMVGPEGKVYGVDMTPNMIELARRNAEKVGAKNVEFRLGEIEQLPIESGSVDVIISNCVINLSPDKGQVFREAFRVLRPGGRLQVSDIVWTKEVPDSVKGDMESWAGCIAGALTESDYLGSIKSAGFTDVTSNAVEYEEGKGLASAAVEAVRP